MRYSGGSIAVPSAPGLGVELDPDKLMQYAELYRELGNYQYDRDPQRPHWFAILPGQEYAKPRVQSVEAVL